MKKATAFAPASVANVAVGFDTLGYANAAWGDRVTAVRTSALGVKVVSITDFSGKPLPFDLPKDHLKNTAAVGVASLLEHTQADFGLELTIEKGIALGSGLGGSAASAVAGVFAANALLPSPLKKIELLKFCLAGEKVASGAAHADNVAPSLMGGLTLVESLEPLVIQTLPLPKIWTLSLREHVEVKTEQARAILKKEMTLQESVIAQARMGAFVTGCFKNDLATLARVMKDDVIEPQRCHLIPHFLELKKAALAGGALCFSISGSGPAVFAWFDSKLSAAKVQDELADVLTKKRIAFDSAIGEIDRNGAKLV